MTERGRVWIIVPAYNEERAVGEVLRGLLRDFPCVVVVDDGSTDATAQAAEALPVHLLRHPVNLGQGAALKTGLDYALARGAEVLVTFDADGQMSPADLPALCEPVLRGEADLVLGSRFLGSSDVPWLRGRLLRLGAWATSLSTGLKLTDVHNGLRALSRKAAAELELTQNRMAHASQILHQAAERRLRVREVPVQVRYTPYSLGKGQRLAELLNIFWDLILH